VVVFVPARTASGRSGSARVAAGKPPAKRGAKAVKVAAAAGATTRR
jgi:hypothetical protein